MNEQKNDYLAELLNNEEIDWNKELREKYHGLGDVWLALTLHEERLYSGYYDRYYTTEKRNG